MAAIVEGAARVLVKRGYANASTNRIANAAGVSIGSVYEYFPDKQSIFTALHHRHLDAVEQSVETALEDLEERSGEAPVPLTELLEGVVGAVVELHARAPALHHRLSSETPQADAVTQRIAAFELRTGDRLAALLHDHPEVHVPDLGTAVTISIQTVEALVHRWVVLAQRSDAAAMASSELVRLVGGYLGGGPPRSPTPKRGSAKRRRPAR